MFESCLNYAAFFFDKRTPLKLVSQGDVQSLEKYITRGYLSLDYRFMSGSNFLSHAITINQQSPRHFESACKVLPFLLLRGIDVNQKRVKKDAKEQFVEQNRSVIQSIFTYYNSRVLTLLVTAGGDFTAIHGLRSDEVIHAQTITFERQRPLRLEREADGLIVRGDHTKAHAKLGQAKKIMDTFAEEEQLILGQQTSATPLAERSHAALVDYYIERANRLQAKMDACENHRPAADDHTHPKYS